MTEPEGLITGRLARPQPQLRLAEPDPQKRGKLFARLMTDFFYALGYDKPRLNIQKSGREIDLSARHRVESRRVVAEFKAHSSPVGGSDVNKFLGVLTRERQKSPDSLQGYFVSLTGFTETALQQEIDAPSKVCLVDDQGIIKELVNAQVIPTPSKASETVQLFAREAKLEVQPVGTTIMVGHDVGWLWLILTGKGKNAQFYSWVHADGEIIAIELAEQIATAYSKTNPKVDHLKCLGPPTQLPDEQRVKDAYANYLAADFGEVELSGLPTDAETKAKRIDIEKLFIPLALKPSESHYTRSAVGNVLADAKRFAILAPPGAGKSTLLKRLAMAYAFPERKTLLADGLPDCSLIPVVLRCRQLHRSSGSGLFSTIRAILSRTELGALELELAIHLIREACRKGTALLLIDGLDEIADSSERALFANDLRAFLTLYPNLMTVVTSRPAGYRIIAGSLAAVCQEFELSEFNDTDIQAYCSAWYREVVGRGPAIQTQARSLADEIIASDRIRALAVNPLLLTTLLLVKHWLGSLPSRRSALYEKAVEVLLMTWNVEGHAPLDKAEIVPQLAFVAHHMMTTGMQQISEPDLRALLVSARRQMPEILHFASMSVDDFIQRVELRSSIIILSGHDHYDGRITRVYEFRHLTFQEYLCALAIADGFYSDRKEGDTAEGMLDTHLTEQNWREVVPLAAVLLGRRCQGLLARLVDAAKRQRKEQRSQSVSANQLLTQCLLDECSASPASVNEILKSLIEDFPRTRGYLESLSTSRYSPALQQLARVSFLEAQDGWLKTWEIFEVYAPSSTDGNAPANRKLRELNNEDLAHETLAQVAALRNEPHVSRPDSRKPCGEFIREIDLRGGSVLLFCAAWLIYWTLYRGRYSDSDSETFVSFLVRCWLEMGDLHRVAVLALTYTRPKREWGLFLNSVDVKLIQKRILSEYPHAKGKDLIALCVIACIVPGTIDPIALRARIESYYPFETRQALRVDLLKILS